MRIRARFEARARLLRFAQADVRAARETLFLGAEEAGKLGTHDSSIAALLETQDRLLSMDVAAPPPPAGDCTIMSSSLCEESRSAARSRHD